MEKYRKKIKKRLYLCEGALIITVAILNFRQFGLFQTFIVESSNVIEFQMGLLVGISVIIMRFLFEYQRALRDENKLRLLYNKEHDERKEMIRKKAGMPMIMITSGVIIFCGIIAGYYSEVVFFTLILTAMIQLTIGAMVKLYCMKVM